MQGIKKAVIKYYVRPKAAYLLRECKSGKELLKKLNWLKESSIRVYTEAQVDEKIQQIFNMSFKEVKLKEKRLRGNFKF